MKSIARGYLVDKNFFSLYSKLKQYYLLSAGMLEKELRLWRTVESLGFARYRSNK